ncbi:hypothetical protein [Hyphomonas sp.]|jgi:poly(3-hydroxybutyrate) depolymerase|uniref:hypothetical protein n=1 Tax=Hyphomonas sp. TaxID=87 RepID=UPI0037BEDFAB
MIKELVFTVGNNVRLAYQFNDFRSSHPIILALHGAAGHPLPFRRISGIDGAVSGFASVIFLAAERHGRVARWSWQKLDDRDFLLSVIDKIVGQGARTEDIYLIGMSNGGCLAHVFASTCDLHLGGIASVCSAMPVYDQTIWRQSASRPCPAKIFLANSLFDPIMPYEGGQTESDASLDVLSLKATIEYWNLRINGKSTNPLFSTVASQIQLLETVQCQYFISSMNDMKMISLTSVSNQHCWDLINRSPPTRRLQHRTTRQWPRRQAEMLSGGTPMITDIILKFFFNERTQEHLEILPFPRQP